MRPRELVWDGCVNVRDLGGLRTEDGRRTRFAAIVRSDDGVRRLSEAGWQAVTDYGVRTIVDLRWQFEVDEDRARDVPMQLVHIPLFDEPQALRAIDQGLLHVTDPAARRSASYLEFLERFRERFGKAVVAVAAAPEGGVLVHCAGGVDRTGLVSALLLRVAGVAIDQIAGDYALSERNWVPFVGEWIAEAEDDAERERRRLLSTCPPQAMDVALTELERRHGSVESYLREAGAEQEALARIRRRLVG